MKKQLIGLALVLSSTLWAGWGSRDFDSNLKRIDADAAAAYKQKNYKLAHTKFTLAENKFRRQSLAGDADAQHMLGTMYYMGLLDTHLSVGAWDEVNTEAERNTEAAKWFRLAANQGHAEAQYNLGEMYLSGRGVPKSHTEALKWIGLSANQGHAEAQYNLGEMYYYDVKDFNLPHPPEQVVPQSYTESAKWFRLAANQGYADAQYMLGGMYLSGNGVPKSYTEGAKWIRLSASQGNSMAILRLKGLKELGF
jgi:TPR repeat protein